jgi:hypothetical protein
MRLRSERITTWDVPLWQAENKLKTKRATSPNFLLARLHVLSYNEVRLTD